MILTISAEMWSEIATGFWQTIYMTLVSTALAYAIGIPVGVILHVTSKEGIKPNKIINFIVGLIVNILRSVPFLILAVYIIPFTRLIVGSSIGTTAMLVPLIVSAAPYIARLVESSLKEVDAGKIEAAEAMGSSKMQIVTKVLLPEAKPSLIIGAAIATATILGCTAMAGFIGGGGLGDIALRYGYHRYQSEVMLVAIIILIVIVQVFQEIGMFISKKIDKRIRKN